MNKLVKVSAFDRKDGTRICKNYILESEDIDMVVVEVCEWLYIDDIAKESLIEIEPNPEDVKKDIERMNKLFKIDAIYAGDYNGGRTKSMKRFEKLLARISMFGYELNGSKVDKV